MQHRYCIVLCHIDLIKNTKAAIFRTQIDRPFPKLDLIVSKRIGADQRTAVHIYMEGNVVRRTMEQVRQILCQNIFSGCLRSGQQNMLPLQ